MIESCEVCDTCDEVTFHSRRQHAPLRWTAALVGLAALGALLGALLDGALVIAPIVAIVALVLLQADRSRRWDLACTRCRCKAVAAAGSRLPIHTTTIDPF